MRSTLLSFAVLLLVVCGCKKETATSPEAVYRAFMLANLEGSEAKIRPLIVERPGSELLWQGAYPAAVVEQLAAQYRTMEIVRIEETPERVSLKSAAAPVPLDVLLQGAEWRLDPAPIIAFRQKAGQRAE